MTKVINVANRLPVTLGDSIDSVQKSSGGLAAALDGLAQDEYVIQMIGWPGRAVKASQRDEVRAKLENDYNCTPVFLSDKEINAYYHGFSNSSLWPILHYNRTYMRYKEADWAVYQEINARFADEVLQHASSGDIVWIHDYHLMLLPALLREANPDLRIGFFFHTPFPSSETFRCHPRRTELFAGVLGADLIGFHTYGYLRHFRNCALRLLGVESEMSQVTYGNHLATLGVYPIGINSQQFERQLQDATFQRTLQERRQHWAGNKIALSVERLDYSKGLLRRLQAIEAYLASAEAIDNIVFVFVSVPSRGEVREYRRLRSQIESEVGRINGTYATTENSPIHFIHQSIPFDELCALYVIADIALVTPLIDGMNLVAKEYIACQSGESGALILSEFAGAAQELHNALIVNPYDTAQVASAITEALAMPLAERQSRMHFMRSRVMQYDAAYWSRSFLAALQTNLPETADAEDSKQHEETLKNLVVKSQNQAFFLDYDGTLRELENKPEDAFPHARLKKTLAELDAAPFDIYIISGRKAETLADWLSDYGFTLIAEHGFRYLLPGAKQWQTLSPTTDDSWKDQVLNIFRDYEGSTPGSFVEDKQSSVVWHYRQTDPEYGQWKAHQLLSDMYEMLANFPVEIHHGKCIVEVSSMHVNKGLAIEHFTQQNNYDLVVCAGDDQTDEAMFRLELPNLVTIKVGEDESHAALRIAGPEELRQLLQRLITIEKNNENEKEQFA